MWSTGDRGCGGPNLRELIEGDYRIVYRVRAPRVEILTVFEGHRRFPLADVATKTPQG